MGQQFTFRALAWQLPWVATGAEKFCQTQRARDGFCRDCEAREAVYLLRDQIASARQVDEVSQQAELQVISRRTGMLSESVNNRVSCH